jgi:hypothetical protein
MAKATIDQLEGGAALCEWFEGQPSFHDATLRELELRQGAPGRLVAETFRMERETDANGYFLLTKHVVVTLTLHDLVEVELFEFMEAGIMSGLDIERDDSGISLVFESSYGVHGRIKVKRVVVTFEPRPRWAQSKID